MNGRPETEDFFLKCALQNPKKKQEVFKFLRYRKRRFLLKRKMPAAWQWFGKGKKVAIAIFVKKKRRGAGSGCFFSNPPPKK